MQAGQWQGEGPDGRRGRRRARQVARWLGGCAVVWLAGSGCTKQVIARETTFPGATAPSVTGGPPGTPGDAASGMAAIDRFLGGVKAQDLQAMSAVWGNAKGLARDQMKRDELEKRLVIMQCLLQHDRYVVAPDRARLAVGGRQEIQIDLTRGSLTARTKFVTLQGSDGRWVVEDIDLLPLKDFCR